MSYYPPPGPPGDYPTIGYSAGAFVPNPRPASVTVISIFAIVLGSLWLLCGAFGLVVQSMMMASGGRNPFMPSMPVMDDKGLLVYQFINGVVDFAVAAVLVAAGIGGLKLRPLARSAMLSLSVFILGWATLNAVVKIVWVAPKTIEYSHRIQGQMGTGSPAAMPAGFETGMQVGAVVVGWVVWCVLPICALIFWRSSRVVAAFEQPPPPFATRDDPNWPQPPNPQPGY